MAENGQILIVDALTKRFGGLTAVDQVTFQIGKGEIFSLIGPNGAGKTTLFNSITGIYSPTSGTVVFEGTNITGLKPYRVAELGIGRTFQQIRLFSYMTAFDNVRVGQHSRMHAKVWDALFKTKRERVEEVRVTEKAMELLKFVGIEQHTHNYARNLPYGHQRSLMALLEVDAVDTYYGRVHALQGVSLSIEEGEIVTLIGSNGAGKTTTLRTISGLTPASKGQVRLRGRDITRLPPDEIVGLGI